MKEVKIIVLVLILSVVFINCAPDLVVEDLNLNWDMGDMAIKKAIAKITNIGNKDAENFLVDFNGDENPASYRRPKVRHNVPGLAKGASVVLYSNFAPLAHLDNNKLRTVNKITVKVDSKNRVKESNENNNEKEFSLF